MGRQWLVVTRHQLGPGGSGANEKDKGKKREAGAKQGRSGAGGLATRIPAPHRWSQLSPANVRDSENCAGDRQGPQDHCGPDPAFAHC